MTSGFGIFQCGQLVLLLGIIVLIWPWRRMSRFVVTRSLRTTPDAAWDALIDIGEILDNGNERHPLIPRNLVSRTKVSEDPEVWEHVYDRSGGRRAVLSVEHRRVLQRDRPRRYVNRIEQWNGTPLPFGAGVFGDYQFEKSADGTCVTTTHEMITRSLWHHLYARRVFAKQLDQVAAFFATGEVPVPAGTRRKLLISIAVSVLAVASFALWLGWLAGLLLAAVLLLHEFGHWLALRLTGQSSPRMMLIPFFGGLAIPEHQHKSAFDEAFCALMGAGLSAVVCAVLLAVWFLLDVPPGQAGWSAIVPPDTHRQLWGLVALCLASAIGLVNLIQLLPIPPLDGGVLLRTILQSTKQSLTRPALLLVAFGASAFAASKGSILVVLLAGIGAFEVYSMQPGEPAGRPMSGRELATIATGAVLTILFHVMPVLLWARKLGFDAAMVWA
jgi:Zn-dependent protease